MASDGSSEPNRHWILLPEPESAGLARAVVESACRRWGVDDEACADALLVVTELVANVVDHAGTRCELTVDVDGGGVGIEVRDFYRCAPPRPLPVDPRAPRGRGLQVVAALSIRWGVAEFDDGKTVWAVLPVSSGLPLPPHVR